MALGPGQPEMSGQLHKVSEERLQALMRGENTPGSLPLPAPALWGQHPCPCLAYLGGPSCSSSKPRRLPSLPSLARLSGQTPHMCAGAGRGVVTPTEDIHGPRRGRQERGDTYNTHAAGTSQSCWSERDFSLSPSSCSGGVVGVGWGGGAGKEGGEELVLNSQNENKPET